MATKVHPDISQVLYDEEAIKKRVQELGGKINKDYESLLKDGKELVIVGILKGAFIYMADLVRCLTVPHRVEFMALSSYGDTTKSSGNVRIIMDLRKDIVDQHVLIVEDILDSGYTLKYLQTLLSARSPASLRTSVFLIKRECIKVEVPIDYLGFEAPNMWLVGYGLDYAEKLRTLPYVGELKRSVYAKD
jgi:hypoxanthine phosphoribosyltransferase